MVNWNQLYDPNLVADICVGMVLHLDPDRLEAEGGTYTCDAAAKVVGQHFFVCLEAGASVTRWLPLYTNPGPGREQLSHAGSSGHPKWINGAHYYHPAQVWVASRQAVANAAARAHDPPWLQKHGWCCACSCALTWRSRGTACKLRLQVPSALRAPAAPHLYVRVHVWICVTVFTD